MDENYVLALRDYEIKRQEFKSISHDLSTAKIISAVYTARISRFEGEEKQEHIEKAKQKQEEYQTLISKYDAIYEECGNLLRTAFNAAPSSRTKQDISDTIKSFESNNIDNQAACRYLRNFLETNFDEPNSSEEEPANN